MKKDLIQLADNVGPDQHGIRAVWSEHSLLVDILFSIHWFCKGTMKSLISLHLCSGWSGPAFVHKLHKGPFSVLRIINGNRRLSKKWQFRDRRNDNCCKHSRPLILLSPSGGGVVVWMCLEYPGDKISISYPTPGNLTENFYTWAG